MNRSAKQIVQHFNASGTALDVPNTVTYFQGPQGPLYRKSALEADPHWYVYDGLGSVVGEVDVNGNLTATKSFDVYGLTRGVTGTPTTRQGFVGGLGHETDDETGLTYMRARYYDPAVGRFASQDPARNGSNWFAYCDSNPVNRVDETGKAWSPPLWACWLVTAICFLLAGPLAEVALIGAITLGGALLAVGCMLMVYDVFSPLAWFKDVIDDQLKPAIDKSNSRHAGGENVSNLGSYVQHCVGLLAADQLVEACLISSRSEIS